jgi:pimeloyl-ACP methyl ester carboxylesterase
MTMAPGGPSIAFHSNKRPLDRARRVGEALWAMTFLLSLVLAASEPPPLGIALEELSYPAPVRFLELTVEGRTERMAYMDVPAIGAEKGVPVVLLHGKNFDSGTWAGTIEALTRAGRRTVVPDQLGFNKSSKPEIAYSFDLLARDTVQLLDMLGIPTADVIGHSTGGMLAVRLAVSHPERVRRLVLVDPVGLEDYRDVVVPQTLERLVQDELEQGDAQIDAFVHRYFVTWRPEFQRSIEWRQRVRRSAEFPRWARVSARLYQMIYEQPMRSELRLVQQPVLLVTGEKDRTVVLRKYARAAIADKLGDYPALSRAAAKEIPRCTRVEVPNVGHAPHLEAPEAFQAAVLPFLAR